jgi:ribosome-associated protein
VVEATRASGVKPLGVEGADQGEWVLVDLGDVVLHLMQPQVREHYQIEKLWDSGRIGGGAVSERR